MSFYALKLLVTVFSFTDMDTAEGDSTDRARESVSLQDAIPGRRSHPPLPPYAMCCIDQSVLQDVLVVAPPHRRRNRSSRRLRQFMTDLDFPSGMGPAPPRVTLQPTHRAPFQEPYPSTSDHSYARGSSRRRSAEGRLSAAPYQPQLLLPQSDGFLRRLQLSLCALCTAYIESLPPSDNIRVPPPSTEHLPGHNAGPIEE